jgi:hypothetical protein
MARAESWAQYALLARRLDAVRAQECARTAGMREGVAEMSAHADELEARLRGQGAMLTNLATTLHLRPPRLNPLPPGGLVDPPTALAQVAGAIDRGDEEARRAAERGQRAGLLPGLGERSRGVLVYLVAAVLVLLAQLPLVRGHVPTFRLIVIVVIPLVGFALAFLVLRLGSRARVAEKARTTPARLGFALCFGIGPVVQLIAVLRGGR